MIALNSLRDADPSTGDPFRQHDLLFANAGVVRARCEGYRDRLRAAIIACPDRYARNLCRQYLAKVEGVLRQPSQGIANFDGITGPNGWAPGIDAAIRSALGLAALSLPSRLASARFDQGKM